MCQTFLPKNATCRQPLSSSRWKKCNCKSTVGHNTYCHLCSNRNWLQMVNHITKQSFVTPSRPQPRSRNQNKTQTCPSQNFATLFCIKRTPYKIEL
ncbi:unnamed protein product [Ixodes pacificus]